jgi:hypothetical protein
LQSNIPAKVALLAAILMGLILALDLAIPLGVAGGVPYVALMFLGSWLPKRRHVITLAVLTSLLTVIGYYYSPSGGIAWMVVSNRGLALFAIWVCALMAIKRMNAEASLGEGRIKSWAGRSGRFLAMPPTNRWPPRSKRFLPGARQPSSTA